MIIFWLLIGALQLFVPKPFKLITSKLTIFISQLVF